MLTRSYSYAELRDDAVAVAYRLIGQGVRTADRIALIAETGPDFAALFFGAIYAGAWPVRSEEHTSELQSLMRNSYAVFCLKKTTNAHRFRPTPTNRNDLRHTSSSAPTHQATSMKYAHNVYTNT